ncbi:tyrosine-protein phosphatase [uncultured Bacteroides sp.]|uniref:tyrosine-protein phosphatase n=1 Tax=uncultured Bacteroides sp. TaxID=162156 RepID=UPI002AAB9E53|nr:tyrosine-protein phosphatase [uncultured Bacteroides sp.]
MYRVLLNWLGIVLLLPSCSNSIPNISVVCEENNVGNCIIKWETAPLIKGKVKVYASTDPNLITEETPVAMANISDQQLTIITDNLKRRYYYMMVFDNKYPVKVATRNINIPGIQNFRDMGGYQSKGNKKLRWGMLYRSGAIDSLGTYSYEEMRNMGIKTIIDLRSKEELSNDTSIQTKFNVVHIPIATGNIDKLLIAIKKDKTKCDTINRVIDQWYRILGNHYQQEYKKIFEILLNKNNYPVIIHCSAGRVRTGIVSALILNALGVNDDTVMNDYLLSNDYYSIPKNISQYACKLPTNSQIAITTLFSAKERFLNITKNEIERRYGDVNTYLEKGLKIKKENIQRLRDILLE